MESAIPSHPPGVEPQGHLFMAEASARVAAAAARRRGLGALAAVEDRLVLRVLEGVGAGGLGRAGRASAVLGCYTAHDALWKGFAVALGGGALPPWRGSWRRTYVAARGVELMPEGPKRTLVFSDALCEAHVRARAPRSVGAAPRGPPLAREQADTLTPAAFRERYEANNGTPVVIEGCGKSAAANSVWDELGQTLGNRVAHAGGVNFALRDFLKYAATTVDDPPHYLFDPTFANSLPELSEAYEKPAYFADDLFDLLPESVRPDYRWLLVGGPRSGQSWHTDPNSTSAWNLTLRGRKRWLFFPPGCPPPGVRPSVDGDGDNYLSPVSMAEWAQAFYADCLKRPDFREGETGPGDVCFVPRGWWHMVLNVDPVLTVAVSHHFASPLGLPRVLGRLRDKPEEVSGVDRGLSADRAAKRARGAAAASDDHRRRRAAGLRLHDALVDALQRARPDILERAEGEIARRAAARAAARRLRDAVPEACKAAFTFSFGAT